LRVSVDITPSIRRRLRMAAAGRDMPVGRYALMAMENQLRHDLAEDLDVLQGLSAEADPLLARLWDNPRDAAYDR
jgi:hypothetical protein